MTTPTTLTKRQAEILTLWGAHQDARGIAPTLTWVAGSFGISKATMHQHVALLVEKGYLSRGRLDVCRTRRVTRKGRTWLNRDPGEILLATWRLVTPEEQKTFLEKVLDELRSHEG